MVGLVFHSRAYSPVLRVLVSQMLGHWFVALPAAAVVGYRVHEATGVWLALLPGALVLANRIGFSEILQIPLLPLARLLRPFGGPNRPFLASLNAQAKAHGLRLDWTKLKRGGDEPRAGSPQEPGAP